MNRPNHPLLSRVSTLSSHRAQKARGSALLVVMIVAVTMGIALAAVLSYVNHAAKIEKRSNLRLESTYAAEYAFENAFQELRKLVQNNLLEPTLAQTTSVTNLTNAPTGVFTSANGYTWKSYLTVPVENGVVVSALTHQDPSHALYKYLTVVEFDRSVPTMPLPVRMSFQREWVYEMKPLFQYAIFFNEDMELFPGASFTVGGRVHSNGKIYTGTSASILFKDYVSHIGGISNDYSPLDPRGPGSPGKTITYAAGDPIMTTREDVPGAVTEDSSDSNHNNDGPRELIEIPDTSQVDANYDERMYTKAGLKVLVNSSGSSVTAANGVTVPAHDRVYITSDGTVIPNTDPLVAYLDTMFTDGTMKDYRENATVSTTDIDVGKLTTAYNDVLQQPIPTSSKWANNATVPAALKNQPITPALQGKAIWNGVLYVTDVTDNSGHRTGVKLVNGQSLPASGLTVATENAAYLVGDYNTGGVPPVDNSSNPISADNYVHDYTVQPAAVMADAVTAVSSNWTTSNYNSVASLNSRNPVNTTINTALISGMVLSDGTAYSGGVENYIRLLENWSGGRRLTYYGSIINLYASKQSKAHWQNTGNYYNAPSRNWYFDTNFLLGRLPPGTPILRTLKRGQWVQLD